MEIQKGDGQPFAVEAKRRASAVVPTLGGAFTGAAADGAGGRAGCGSRRPARVCCVRDRWLDGGTGLDVGGVAVRVVGSEGAAPRDDGSRPRDRAVRTGSTSARDIPRFSGAASSSTRSRRRVFARHHGLRCTDDAGRRGRWFGGSGHCGLGAAARGRGGRGAGCGPRPPQRRSRRRSGRQCGGRESGGSGRSWLGLWRVRDRPHGASGVGAVEAAVAAGGRCRETGVHDSHLRRRLRLPVAAQRRVPRRGGTAGITKENACEPSPLSLHSSWSSP